MKEPGKQVGKSQISVIAQLQMTPDQQASFLAATDALLVELIHELDRRTKGEPYGTAADEMAR